MKRWIVIQGLGRLPIVNLVDYSQAVVTAMDSNPFFPVPAIALSTVSAKAEELGELVQKARELNSSPADTARMHSYSFKLITDMRLLGSYVEHVANENHRIGDSIIFSANMGIKSFPVNTGRTFDVRNTAIAGQVIARTRSAGRAAYEWQYTTTPEIESSWQRAHSTSVASIIISGLEPVTRVYFRVRANKDKVGPWQGPVDVVVN